MNTFDSIWSQLQTTLKPDQAIQNWTVLKGYLGDQMKISGVGSSYIAVDAPNANTTQIVSKEDFEKVWKIWPNYRAGTFPRYQIRDMTRFSKYIISILHWMDQGELGLPQKN